MRRWPRYLGRIVPLLCCLAALAGCLQRVTTPPTGPNAPAIATVPAAFFVATPYARTPTVEASSGRYILGKVELLAADDPRASYAAPLRQRETAFVQVGLRIVGLAEPRTPGAAYELVTEAGVFGALASGEWEAAVANGAAYDQEGVLLFVVPGDLRAGRLEIVAYAYPQGAAGTLQRRVLAAFDLPRFR